MNTETLDAEKVDAAEAEPKETANDDSVKVDKVQQRIDELTAQKAALTKQKYADRQEKEQLKQEIDRLKQVKSEAGDVPPLEEVQKFVKAEAERIVSETKFNEICNAAYDSGVKEFGDSFKKSVESLNSVIDPSMARDVWEALATSDVGPKVINFLGSDLDEAERITSLSPFKMAKELAKLEIELAKPKKNQTSNAPKPIEGVGGKGEKSAGDPNDFESYLKWRRKA